MFCLLVVLAKLSLLAKWLARKTPLRKRNRGEGIISIKPRPKSAHDFLGLLYCFIVLLCIYVVSCPYVIYYPTVMARYSLFVLKVPLNPKQTNKQTTNQILLLLLLLHSDEVIALIIVWIIRLQLAWCSRCRAEVDSSCWFPAGRCRRWISRSTPVGSWSTMSSHIVIPMAGCLAPLCWTSCRMLPPLLLPHELW